MTDSPTSSDNLQLTGIGVSRGIVIARAQLIGRTVQEIHEVVLGPDQVEEEIKRFNQALKASEDQLEGLRARVAKILGERDARIFDGHLLLIADEVIIEEVKERIRSECRNAEFVFDEVIDRYAQALSQVSDSYIRDRLTDIRDVAARVINNLRGVVPLTLDKVTEPSVIIAQDISPSDTAAMNRDNVLGFVTAVGSRTSHSAIMARSMNIPAVVGVTGVVNQISNGDPLIVDGLRGRIIVRPDARTIERYRRRLRSQQEWWRIVEAEMALPAETVDGYRAQLAANIELPEEVEQIRQSYGVGVGLFRTEYLFIDREEIPTEDEQYKAYQQVAEDIFPHSVIIRTLDIGGDKFMSKLQMPVDMNPFLGVRAIRFCLQRPDIFITQLRAILRSTVHGKVRIMFPMIATVEELQKALGFLEEAKDQLSREGIDYSRRMDVGIMIEVPSAAIIADCLAKQVDFFSIGTNDLVQYSLAADRGNPEVAYLYQPGHPSIIRLLKHVADAASHEGKWVSLCGEMASDPLFVPLILGLGIHELSMGIHSIGIVKRLIRRIRMYDAEKLVEEAMTCASTQEVINLCEAFVARTVPDLLPKIRI